MAVIESGPLSSLYSIDRSHIVNLLVEPLNIVWWGRGGIWVEEWFKLCAHCLKNMILIIIIIFFPVI